MIKDLLKVIITRLNNNSNKNIKNCFNDLKNYNGIDWKLYKSNFTNTQTIDYYKKIIYQNKNFELILIKWDKDSKTKIHKHPKNGCIMKVLDGKLIEKRFNKDNICKESKLEINSIGYIDDNIGTHQIIALEESYSIHLYSPPGFYNTL